MNPLLVTWVFAGAAARCGRGQSVLVAALSKATCSTEVLLPLCGFKKTWTKVRNVPGHPGAAWHPGRRPLLWSTPACRLAWGVFPARSRSRGSWEAQPGLPGCCCACRHPFPKGSQEIKAPVPVGELGCFKPKKPCGCRTLLAATRGAFSSMSKQQLLLLRPFWLC